MKIIYSIDINPNVKSELEIIENLRHLGFTITLVDWMKELGIDYYPTAAQIKNIYESKDAKLMKLYQKISNLSMTHDVLIVGQSHVYLPEFIESLNNIYTVFYSADDPDSSDICSKPYVKHYDHIFAAGVNFNGKSKITEKFLEWGAKRADWWPLGFRNDAFNPNLTIEDIYQKERDIDLVFVGDVWTSKRRNNLIKLKSAFPQMSIISRNFRDFRLRILINLCFIAKSGRCSSGKYLSHAHLSDFYQNVKIGINMHHSFGPSNIRTYQLPANGIMQLCDCSEGLDQVFNVGKEVVTYNSIDEAIELIKYYLDNDEERKKIATAGFKRAKNDYNREITFLRALEKIEKGIIDKNKKRI